MHPALANVRENTHRNDAWQRLKTFWNLLNEWMCQTKRRVNGNRGQNEIGKKLPTRMRWKSKWNGINPYGRKLWTSWNRFELEKGSWMRARALARSCTHGKCAARTTWDISLAAVVVSNMWQVKLFAYNKRRTNERRRWRGRNKRKQIETYRYSDVFGSGSVARSGGRGHSGGVGAVP